MAQFPDALFKGSSRFGPPLPPTAPVIGRRRPLHCGRTRAEVHTGAIVCSKGPRPCVARRIELTCLDVSPLLKFYCYKDTGTPLYMRA